ncbi:brain acid soluble protein 1 isoform X2 [Ambystoma mexicanum]|uniref:brain acid soluble protein 1 isoform X2 n=1 Tax=Ambystoma mexicanum TaxID=8296 RepID=UPI0037E850AC
MEACDVKDRKKTRWCSQRNCPLPVRGREVEESEGEEKCRGSAASAGSILSLQPPSKGGRRPRLTQPQRGARVIPEERTVSPECTPEMGGKLSKKKKGYNVSDDKAKDKKADGAATEGEAPKGNEEAQPPVENADAKEIKDEKNDKDSQATDNKAEDKEGEKDATNKVEAQKSEPEKQEACADAKAEVPKAAPQATKQEEQAPAPAPAPSSEPAKAPEPSSNAKVSQPSEATATSKVEDKSKEEVDAKNTEAPSAPAAQEAQIEVAPASDSKPCSNEAVPSSIESPATDASSSTPKASGPVGPAEEVKAPEVPVANSDQAVAVQE